MITLKSEVNRLNQVAAVSEVFSGDMDTEMGYHTTRHKTTLKRLYPDIPGILIGLPMELVYKISEGVAGTTVFKRGTVIIRLSERMMRLVNETTGAFNHIALGETPIYVHTGNELEGQFLAIDTNNIAKLRTSFNELRNLTTDEGKLLPRRTTAGLANKEFKLIELLISSIVHYEELRPQNDLKYCVKMDSDGIVIVDAKVYLHSSDRWATRDSIKFKADFSKTYSTEGFNSEEFDTIINFSNTTKSKSYTYDKHSIDFLKAIMEYAPNCVLHRSPISLRGLAGYLESLVGKNNMNVLYNQFLTNTLTTKSIEDLLPEEKLPTVSRKILGLN